MKVNSSKTAIICVSGTQSYRAESHIFDTDSNIIRSGETMKLLGFQLSNKPGVHAQVEALCKRMRRKYWVLYHLKKAGFTQEGLAKVYRTCILPVADYCSVAYHSLLTDEQDQIVERLQAAALRCIYGHDVPYSKMRQLVGVDTLRQRRIDASNKFAQKCLANRRFMEWFPLKKMGRAGGRRAELYHEDYARCNRLRDSTIYYMRRRLNGKEGKMYGERNRQYRDTGGKISETMNAARKKTSESR